MKSGLFIFRITFFYCKKLTFSEFLSLWQYLWTTQITAENCNSDYIWNTSSFTYYCHPKTQILRFLLSSRNRFLWFVQSCFPTAGFGWCVTFNSERYTIPSLKLCSRCFCLPLLLPLFCLYPSSGMSNCSSLEVGLYMQTIQKGAFPVCTRS